MYPTTKQAGPVVAWPKAMPPPLAELHCGSREQYPLTIRSIHSRETLPGDEVPYRSVTRSVRSYEFLLATGFDPLDTNRIKALLEISFGKKLVDGYFAQPVERILVEKNYLGIAIVKDVRGVPYLDKLVVLPEAQGNGLANAIWEYLTWAYPSLIWRASPTNPINSWYAKKCEGFEATEKWTIYWYGLDPGLAKQLLPVVVAIPPTLIKVEE